MRKAKMSGTGLTLSAELRRLVELLAGDLPAQVESMLRAERSSIADYASITDASTRRDVYDATTTQGRIWYQCLLAGRPPTTAELEPFTEFGRRRLRQGFDLPSLLHAIRIASIELWSVLIAKARRSARVRDELLLQVSPFLLQHFDLTSRAVTQGYIAEGQQRARWREQLKDELGNLLFSRPDDLAGFRELLRALDLDAAAPYAALAIRLQEQVPGAADAAAGHDELQHRIAKVLGLPETAFFSRLRHGHLLLWLRAETGELLIEQEQRLATLAAKLGGKNHGLGAIALGLPASGPGGWRESADQALQALELGRHLGSAGRVWRYAELALDDAVRTSRGPVRYLESLIERLAAESSLLETLDAFFRNRQHRKACAAELGIHINTLAYRLERIETLLGARLDDASWLARLYAALRLRPPPRH